MVSDQDSNRCNPLPTSLLVERDHPVELLLTWFSDNKGWLNPNVRIIFDNSHGFHVIAAKPLSSPTVARCPLSLTLSYLCLDHSQDVVPHVHSPLQKCLGKVPDFVLNYLFLVEQRLLGKDSQWYPYIICLPGPETMNTPIWFSEEDLHYLQGTNLMQATKDRQQQLHEQWDHAQAVMKDTDVAIPSEFNFDQFRWASTIMSSRAFISDHILPDRPTFPILFPVVDILNHSVEAKVEWNFHPFQDFTLNILEHVKEGEEIFNNYAPKQNDELLMGYGFCIQDNPMEQFAIRMAVPPEIGEEVKGNVELEEEQIPFGMPKSCLDGNLMRGQHFLRTRDHPLGRYENMIPCFQGFAPHLVYASFLAALYARDLKLAHVNLPNPGARIFLGSLKILYQAVRNRCERLPLRYINTVQFPNDKQKYAAIYRKGQAETIHLMRLELRTVLERRRVHRKVSMDPAIITTTEALFALKADFPDHYQNFRDVILLQGPINLQYSSQYAQDIALFDVEDLIWVYLLIVFATHTLSSRHDTLIHSWMQDLFSSYPLSSNLPSPDDSPSYKQILRSIRILSRRAKNGNTTWTAVTNLDELGLSLPHASSSDNVDPTLVAGMPGYNGPVSGLREKLILWALNVVETERIELLDHDKGGIVRQCLYMRAWKGDRGDEDWIFEDFGIDDEVFEEPDTVDEM